MFSVGMATYDDFDGVWFSVMSLLAHHAEHVAEVLVIDNNPGGKVGQSLRQFIQNGSSKVRYIPYTEATGTAQPRNEVFRQATQENVVCIDSHVMLLPGALAALQPYMQSGDLLQGPLVMDNLVGLATHFQDVWNAEMWGVWGDDERADHADAFEIPAQGLGMFACRKDAWLGFNPAFRGFGGEEFYIHEKYRKAGRKALCVSGARWVHRFGRPAGVPYPLDRYNKVRNYCIGLQELGIDLERCRVHFAKVLKPGEWDAAVRGDAVPPKSCSTCNGMPSLEAWFAIARDNQSDINEHAITLAELAAGKSVVDCGMRFNVSTVALAYGKPKALQVVALSKPAEVDKLATFGVPVSHVAGDSLTVDTTPCDLLFLDTIHEADRLWLELEKWRGSATRIAIHDTVSFGERGELGGAGVMHAIRRLVRTHPEWIVQRHDRNNNGLLVLSRDPADRKTPPGMLRQASSFAAALARHVANGATQTDAARFELRLATCDECPSRNLEKCGECGCPIEKKAAMESEKCPLGKW